MNFKINFRTFFTIIFKVKNDNTKARNFSPLIERVLAGVSSICKLKKLAFREFTDYNSYSIFHFQHSFLACLFLLFPDILVKEMHRIRLPFIVTKKTLTCCYSWVLLFSFKANKIVEKLCKLAYLFYMIY